jgi:hypothetical protein
MSHTASKNTKTATEGRDKLDEDRSFAASALRPRDRRVNDSELPRQRHEASSRDAIRGSGLGPDIQGGAEIHLAGAFLRSSCDSVKQSKREQ